MISYVFTANDAGPLNADPNIAALTAFPCAVFADLDTVTPLPGAWLWAPSIDGIRDDLVTSQYCPLVFDENSHAIIKNSIPAHSVQLLLSGFGAVNLVLP